MDTLHWPLTQDLLYRGTLCLGSCQVFPTCLGSSIGLPSPHPPGPLCCRTVSQSQTYPPSWCLSIVEHPSLTGKRFRTLPNEDCLLLPSNQLFHPCGPLIPIKAYHTSTYSYSTVQPNPSLGRSMILVNLIFQTEHRTYFYNESVIGHK